MLSLLLVGGGIFLYVQELVKKDEIKVSIEETLSKTLPGAKVVIGDLSVKYGTSIHLKLDKLQIDQKFPVNSYDFLKADDIQVKVPLLSILLGGGNIEVTMNQPILSLQEKKGDKNWINVFKSSQKLDGRDKSKPKEESANIILPSFLLNSTATIRVNHSNVNYELDKTKGSLEFSKLVFKNVGLNAVTAFEIQSSYQRKNGDEENENFSFLFTLVGSLDFAKYLRENILSLKTSFSVKDLFIKEQAFPLTVIRGDLAASLEKNGVIKGNFKSSASDNELSSQFKISDGDIFLDSIAGTIYLMELRPYLSKNFPFDLDKAKLKVTGNLYHQGGAILPQLDFTLSAFNINIRDSKLPTRARLKTFNEEVTLNLESDLLGGKLLSVSKLNFNINSNLPLEERISYFSIDLKVSNINLQEKNLFGFFKSLQREELLFENLLPRGVITISSENMKLGGERLEGGATLKTDKNSISLSNFSLITPAATLKAKGNLEFFKDKSQIKLMANYKGIEIAGLYNFLDPNGRMISGKAQGSFNVTGEVSKEKLPIGRLKISIEEPMLTGFKTKDLFIKVTEAIKGSVGGTKYLSLPIEEVNKFSNLEAEIVFNEGPFKIEKLSLNRDSELGIDLKGNVDWSGEKETSLKVFLKDASFNKNYLRKKTKLSAFPISMDVKNLVFDYDLYSTLGEIQKNMKSKKDRNLIAKKLKQMKKKEDLK